MKVFYLYFLLFLPVFTINKKALIFGVTGQDGSYLSEFLLSKGYEVHGVKRRSSSLNTERIDHIFKDLHNNNNKFFLHYGDLADLGSIIEIIGRVDPDEVYDLGAQSHVRTSFDIPIYTADVTALGTIRVLEAIKILDKKNKIRFYQASSSEMFGKVKEIPQRETTPFHPRSPYAVSKVFSYWATVNYRESYGMFTCNGILFNHESPRRGETFVTRKITRAVARIKKGLQDTLFLGNLNAKRDWGYAKDYIEAMWLILQQEKPDDYVISTGETHSVREFVEKAFNIVGITIEWKGSGLEECGYDLESGKVLVKIDSRYFRPSEVDFLLGDCSKSRKKLGWFPKTTFDDLVKLMVEDDIKLLEKKI